MDWSDPVKTFVDILAFIAVFGLGVAIVVLGFKNALLHKQNQRLRQELDQPRNTKEPVDLNS